MQCSVCHFDNSSGSSFCGQCGAPLGAAASSGAGAPPSPAYSAVPPGYAAAPAASPASAGISDNAASAIAYLTIIPAIVFLVLEPYNRVPLVRFHSWQSILLGITAFVLQILVMIVQMLLHFVPGIFLLFSLIHLVIALGVFLAWLVAIVKASKGEWYKLPLIGDLAEKQARG